ncbi:MAG: DUF4965 domain-containing protein, partial [Armatimonadetes bacterium]|nr:DUF4965 domain-containing protein [Armatimonadota bacterium]
MPRSPGWSAAPLSLLLASAAAPADRPPAPWFAPPAVPLVACDPYFSVWSGADRLTDDVTRHWTGRSHPLGGIVRVDGRAFRLIGPDPAGLPALSQTDLAVTPTRTIYGFGGAGIHLRLTFTTPRLPDDLDVLARPVTYVAWEARSTDDREHRVEVEFDASAVLTVDHPEQAAGWSREAVPGLDVLRLGSADQSVLRRKGDDLRIEWGYLYVAAPQGSGSFVVGSQSALRDAFAATGKLPEAMDTRQPRAAGDDPPAAALAFDLGAVGPQPVARWLMLAYDDLYGIQYFGENLRPYWRRKGAEAADLLTASLTERDALLKRCAALDEELLADCVSVGGPAYADIAALAYRQCFAGSKLCADANGQPLLFPKECFSNGCIATVDVIYPMAPQLLLLSPSLAKAMLVPVLDYAASPRWKWPFAPHDLGTYPLANGQVYGGGERTEENQMPVEESGNLLILLAALAKCEGNADFAAHYRPVLAKWAEYLKAQGFDPANQLCTDDFAGHLAHNVNLSAKAILGLASYGLLCAEWGDQAGAAEYGDLAKQLAARWVREADDGDHFRLAFDKPGTWSQKYNVVWDRILGLGLFPPEALAKEMAFYRRSQQ